MARNELRPVVKLRYTARSGQTYVSRKNRRNDPDRPALRKYDPVAGRHVDFRDAMDTAGRVERFERRHFQPGAR